MRELIEDFWPELGEQAPTEIQLTPMALTMRPAGLSSGIDRDRADCTVFCGEWNIGRIYEVRGGPEHLRWFGIAVDTNGLPDWIKFKNPEAPGECASRVAESRLGAAAEPITDRSVHSTPRSR